MFVITDIGKLFLFFTYHDNHVIHGSRILFFLDYGSQKINSVDHVSRETPYGPSCKTKKRGEVPLKILSAYFRNFENLCCRSRNSFQVPSVTGNFPLASYHRVTVNIANHMA